MTGRCLLKATYVELKLFIRDPLTVIFALVLPLLVLFILGSVFGNHPSPKVYRGVGPMNYYVPAYLGLVLASFSLISLPVQLAAYRERGVMRRFRASAIPLWVVLVAEVIVTLVVGAVAGALLVAAAWPAYHMELPKSDGGVLLAFLLSALAFAGLGLLLGTALPSARSAQGIGVLLWFVMMMIDGPGPPLEVLSSNLRHVSDLTPLLHVVRLIQDPWLGFGWNLREMFIVAAFGLASTVGALTLIRRTT